MNTIYKHFLVLVSMAFLPQIGFGQINAGELMFVGFNADGDDGFAVVALAEIPASSTIYFTDKEWNGMPIGSGGAFNSGEAVMTWNTGGSAIAAGTVITFDQTNGTTTVTVGSVSGGGINLAASNEVLYAFVGFNNASPTTFLSAIGNTGFGANGTLDNTGLAAGVTAISISGSEDVMVYDGSTICNTTVADCAGQIAAGSWDTQDGTGDQSNDLSAPNFPVDVPASFSGSALPVHLLYFSVVKSREGALLSWATATEENNHYFNIERSIDAKNWSSMARIEGAGTSYETLEYSFLDERPSSGTSYYRLKQTDYDGAYFYSDIESVHYKPSRELSLFPNPVTDALWIRGEGLTVVQLQLFNSLGQLQRVKVLQGEYEEFQLDVSHLPSGLYFLKAVGVSDWPASPIVVR